MITTRLSGGLANQMFQYAAGRRLAHHHNTALQLDISHYNEPIKADTQWSYALDCFQIVGTTTKKAVAPSSVEQSRLSSLISKTRLAASPVKLHVLREKHFQFDPHVLGAPDNCFLDGYWQSQKYFEDICDVIRKDFVFTAQQDPPNRRASQAIKKTNAISLHVRRGDYVSNTKANEFHGTTTLDYYNQAVNLMAQHTNDPHFFIFSDDPDWCKQHLFIDQDTTYIDHNKGAKSFEDMRLMSQCRHHIIANSSFSWWGAWLNPRTSKSVIAPKQWFKDTSIKTADLIPETWTRI